MPVSYDLFSMKKEANLIFEDIKKLWNTITKESLFEWIVELESKNSPFNLFETKVDGHNFDEWVERNCLRLYRIILQLDVVNPLKLPLHLCIEKGASHAAKVLIKDGEDLEAKDSFGQTPLHCACATKTNSKNIVKILLENGANVNSVGRHGFTPIFLAVFGNHVETLLLLLLHGANPNIFCFGQPIYFAMQYNHINIVKTLVLNGSKIDVISKEGGFETLIECVLLEKRIKCFKVTVYNSN